VGGEGDEGVARAVELRYLPSLLLEPIAVPCRCWPSLPTGMRKKKCRGWAALEAPAQWPGATRNGHYGTTFGSSHGSSCCYSTKCHSASPTLRVPSHTVGHHDVGLAVLPTL
jgi:hypothetical protein